MITKLINLLYSDRMKLPNDNDFYYQAIEEIESYYLAPQTYTLLKEQGRFEQTPLFFQVRLKQQYQAILYQNFLIKDQTDRILEKLETASLTAIPLKGVYFAEKYFGHLGARATSDIDLLIKEQDIKQVIETVIGMGFTMEEEPIPGHFHCSFSKAIPGSSIPLTVEVHWNILRESTSSLTMENFWKAAVPMKDYQYIKVLSDHHTFYAICLHGWRHNLDSPKHFLDIIQLILCLEGRLDYERLLNDAKQDQTLKRIRRTLSIVYQQYPWLNHRREFSYQTNKRQESQKKIGQYIHFINYQFFSYDSFRHSLIEMFHWLLPSRFELAAELGTDTKKASYLLQLIFLYKKRGTSALKAIVPH